MAASTIKGITIEIGGDTTKLDKALSGVNKQSRDLQKELKEVEKGLKLDPKNTELLAQKQTLLKEAVAATSEKLDVLKSAEAQVQKQFENGEVSEEQYRALQREIIKTEADLKNLKTAAEDSNSTLEKAGEIAGKIGKKSEALGKKLLPVTGAIAGIGTASIAAFNELDAGYDTIITKTGASGEALDGLQDSMDAVFTSLPTEAETAGIAIGEVNTRFGSTGKELEDLSSKFIQFSEINGTDLNGAIDSVDAIMTKFGVDSSHTGEVLGLLTKAGQDTGISMDTLQNTLQTNGATLKEMGLQATMKNLMTYETKLAKAGTIGYRFRPDFRNRKIIFETYKGTDRTTAQGINSRVIFSESYNNLNNVIYKYNDQQYRTKAIVGGEGEGAARVYVEVGGGAGLDLREIFVDAKDIQSEGLTDAAYKAALAQRGRETLAANVVSESVECETEADINFKYKTHYDLGDIVTVKKKKWGIVLNQRITELQEVYEYGGMYVVPTMGDALPEKIDWSDK